MGNLLIEKILMGLTSCFCAVKYEVQLEDGTTVAKSDGVEFTVKEGE